MRSAQDEVIPNDNHAAWDLAVMQLSYNTMLHGEEAQARRMGGSGPECTSAPRSQEDYQRLQLHEMRISNGTTPRQLNSRRSGRAETQGPRHGGGAIDEGGFISPHAPYEQLRGRRVELDNRFTQGSAYRPPARVAIAPAEPETPRTNLAPGSRTNRNEAAEKTSCPTGFSSLLHLLAS